jgi:hypothetical protein
VESVLNTRIFARSSKDGKQYVVYTMSYKADQELAMVLPLPVAQGAGENAVRFIDLRRYPTFFDHLNRGFPAKRALGKNGKSFGGLGGTGLAVVEVGDYEASYVPTAQDFARLDERFRLPDGVWAKLPSYLDFGFAVFKLKRGTKKVHPMAFEFPRREARRLFFPTLHIHDGQVHPEADFDHVLYCQQNKDERLELHRWQESERPAGMFMDLKRSAGLIDRAAHCYRLHIRGNQKNEDILV